MGFTGRAFLMESDQLLIPNFKAALSVEADVNGRFLCSIQVFLGDFKVWNSGHYSKFYPSKRCVLELTEGGDLQLKGSTRSRRRIGWRSGTSGQGVEQRLQLLSTGNLVLMDAMNRIRWQSFEFPTNVILWGQRFNYSTRLTSFPGTNSTMFYSFEIQNNKIALYLNSGRLKYSYWEFRPSHSRNIVSAQLGSTGLKLFDGNHRKIGQISSRSSAPLRFLALRDNTGNLGLYHYSPHKSKFAASFTAINETCDLPLACGSYGICTFSNTCTCIQFSKKTYPVEPNCNVGFHSEFCGSREPVEMVEIMGVSSILKGDPQMFNVSKEECLSLCIGDCTCVALLYSNNGIAGGDWQQCFHYGLVRGLKQIGKEGVNLGLSYFVKVPKGIGGATGKKSSVVKKWLLIMGGVVDGLVILLVLGGFGYYFFVVRKRRLRNDNTIT
ncbi:S-locus glycoprotein [Macleaya cordata]|uniref:S-locus glycoprotein n=1 Tax=Macleaya cordata TaxID=56857 RepID=A0A200R3E1_MACCD|nr:S-locus glycoprotein [Macleaya cordata]